MSPGGEPLQGYERREDEEYRGEATGHGEAGQDDDQGRGCGHIAGGEGVPLAVMPLHGKGRSRIVGMLGPGTSHDPLEERGEEDGEKEGQEQPLRDTRNSRPPSSTSS